MTIIELKAIIENLPDLMDVFIDERVSDFRYGLVNTATVKRVGFIEDPDSKEVLAEDDVLILSEE